MLTIVLGALQILGIVLLALLGLALTVLLLVLFFPITYRVRGRREPDGCGADGNVRWNTWARARFRWLFGFVHGGIDYPEPGQLTVKVLWFTVFSSGGDNDKSIKKKKANKTGTSKQDEKTKKSKEPGEPEQAETPPKGIAGIFEKIRYTISDICDKIKQIYTKEERYRQILTSESTKGLVRHLWMRLCRLLRAIRPRHIKADLRLGTGAPDTTGYALALYGMLSPRVGWAVNLTPDFEEKVLEGRAKLSGHIILAVVLWHAAKAALDPRLRRLIRQLKAVSRKGQGNGNRQGQ